MIMSEDRMERLSLSTSSINRLVLFLLLMAPAVFLFVGIIPASLLVYGLAMALWRGDFNQINLSIRNCNIYLFLAMIGGLVSVVIGLYYVGTNFDMFLYDIKYSDDRPRDATWRYNYTFGLQCSVFGFGAIALAFIYKQIIQRLFLIPLNENKDWLMSLKMPRFQRATKKIGSRGIRVVVDKPLPSAEVIDDIARWEKLKDEGRITQEEYDEIRIKILQRI